MFNARRRLSICFIGELALSTSMNSSAYYSTLVLTPVVQPTAHSRTMFLENYRAATYMAAGVAPMFKFSETLYLHTGGYAFQPYKSIMQTENRGVALSSSLPRPSFIAEAAVVWQTPIGPLSLGANYYSRNTNNYYFVFNFGYIIFNKRGINY